MKKLFTALILFSCVTIPLYSQGNVLVPVKERPSTALLFSLYGLNTFGAGNFDEFAGPLDSISVGFGIKHFVSSNFAIRGGVGFDNQSVSQDLVSVKSKITGMRFFIMPGVEYHLLRSGSVSAYVGGQLIFGILKATIESTPSGLPTSTDESSATIFGLGPFLGVEWFAFDNVSLSAEYQLNFITGSGKDKRTENGTTTEVDTGPSTWIGTASNGRLNVNIAFYF